MIDPSVIVEATRWAIAEIQDALRQAAAQIRYYQAARWTVGIVRRQLPPHYELRTWPESLDEIELPSVLDSATVNTWASSNIDDYRARIVSVLEPAIVQTKLYDLSARFDDAFIAVVEKVLLWSSAKNLLAGMADWLVANGVANPGAFRALLRDWSLLTR